MGWRTRACLRHNDPVAAGVINAGIIVNVAVCGIGARQPGHVPNDNAVVLQHFVCAVTVKRLGQSLGLKQ